MCPKRDKYRVQKIKQTYVDICVLWGTSSEKLGFKYFGKEEQRTPSKVIIVFVNNLWGNKK